MVQCLARKSNQSDLQSSPTMSKLQICVTRCHEMGDEMSPRGTDTAAQLGLGRAAAPGPQARLGLRSPALYAQGVHLHLMSPATQGPAF